MSPGQEKLHYALRAVAAGDFDALTPEQVAELERALNENPQVAALIASAVPVPDARLAAGLAELEQKALPSQAAWDQAWGHVDAATAGISVRTQGKAVARVIRLWKPLLAAAACLILVAVWRFSLTPANDAWPIQLATNVEIDALDVDDDATPLDITTADFTMSM